MVTFPVTPATGKPPLHIKDFNSGEPSSFVIEPALCKASPRLLASIELFVYCEESGGGEGGGERQCPPPLGESARGH